MQHMPHSSSATCGSTHINRQPNILPASTLEISEKEAQAATTQAAAAQTTAKSTAPTVTAVAEQTEEIARAEVAH